MVHLKLEITGADPIGSAHRIATTRSNMPDFSATDVGGAILRAQVALLDAIGPILVITALGLCFAVVCALVYLCLGERRCDDRSRWH